MKSIGHEGLNNLLVAYEDKSAQAVATFGFSRGPGQEPLLFQGKTDVSFFILGLFFFSQSKRCDASHRRKQGKIVPARGPTLFGMCADPFLPVY